jgi:glycerol-3-phosphate acyltransferase PlsX
VVVCEGFVGNVVLKTAEGLYEVIAQRLKETVNDMARDAGNGSEGKLIDNFRAHMDWAEYGGAPLLGVNGLVLISHGRSHARAIRNALMQAARLQRGRFLQKMTEDLRSS